MRITFLYSVILYIKSPRLSEYSLSEHLADKILDKVVALYFGLILVLLPPENHLR
jgi:hypothetical protein